MKKEFLVLLTVFLFVLSACSTQQPGQPPAQKESGTIKIGVMYPLTGDAASYGQPILKTTKFAADDINAKGGINGKNIELVIEDSKCNPKDGNAAAQKLINVDKVKVIIGGVCSGETLGAAPLANDNKVVMLSPSATSPDITTKGGDFVFRLAPSDAYAGVVASDYAFKDLKKRKAAVISESTDYAQGLRRVFKENFAKLGGQIVADETFNSEDSEFRTQVTKVKAAGADVIYVVPQTKAKGVLLVKEIKEAGLNTQLLTAEVLIGRDVVKENGADVDGMIGVEQKFDDKSAKAAPLLARYKNAAKEDAPFPAYQSAAYDAVALVSDAIAKNGYDGEKIRDYLYSVKDYDGTVGKVSLDSNGDVVLDFSVKQVKSNQLAILK